MTPDSARLESHTILRAFDDHGSITLVDLLHYAYMAYFMVLFLLIVAWNPGGIRDDLRVWIAFVAAMLLPWIVVWIIAILGLRKSAQLTLTVPDRIFEPGEEIPISISLQLNAPSPLQSIEVRFQGREMTQVETVGRQRRTSRVRESRALVDEARRLVGEDELRGMRPIGGPAEVPCGVYSYAATFRVPVGALGSYAGENIAIAYTVTARADVARGVDYEQEVPVLVAPTANSRPEPSSEDLADFSLSGAQRWIATKLLPTDALSLTLEASPTIVPGEALEGHVAVRNPAGKRIRELSVAVVRIERATAEGKHGRTERAVAHLDLPWLERKEGSVPFRLEMPDAGFPYKGELSSLSYVVEAYAVVDLGRVLTAPTQVRKHLMVLPRTPSITEGLDGLGDRRNP